MLAKGLNIVVFMYWLLNFYNYNLLYFIMNTRYNLLPGPYSLLLSDILPEHLKMGLGVFQFLNSFNNISLLKSDQLNKLIEWRGQTLPCNWVGNPKCIVNSFY